LEENEDKTAEDFYREANELYEKGEFEKAIRLYNEAILRDRVDKYFFNRGLCYACLERYEEAKDDILRVLELKPDFADAWYILGLAKEYMQDLDGALQDYDKALELNPDHRDAKNRKELIKSRKHNHESCLLSKAGSSKGTSYEHAATLERVRNREKEGRFEEALELIEEKLKKDPDDFRLLISKRTLKAKIEASSKPEIICGLDEIKDEIDTFITSPLTNQNPLYRAEIVQSSKGVLLHGPPGGGKNHLTINSAKAAGIQIIEVALHEILNMWAGESEKRIKTLFDTAKDNAEKGKPTMIFVNEMDALGLSRSMTAESGEASWSRDLRSTFRVLIDQVQRIPNLVIVGATNYVWSVDDALKRPGRFGGCIIYIGPPDDKTREKLFKHYSRETPGHNNLNFKKLAKITPWFTPDDIREICKKVHLQLAKKNDEAARTRDYEKLIEKRFPVALTWLRKVAKAWINGEIEDDIDERLLNDICQVNPAAKAKREALERELRDAKERLKRTKREHGRTKHQTVEYIS
jgi:SpoVK/Ycf46/Vps4 family AAA+-type ATPase